MRPRFFDALQGSQQNFLKRNKPRLTEEQERVEREKRSLLTEGIVVLRQLKTRIFEQPQNQQELFELSYAFADAMANCILADSLDPDFQIKNDPYPRMLQDYKHSLRKQSWKTKHETPATTPIHTMYLATEDMLLRAERLIGSIENPKHQITKKEAEEILDQYLFGTNRITAGKKAFFFEPNVRIGSVMSGGLIYSLIAKKIIEYLSEDQIKMDVFATAVDNQSKAVKHQVGRNDQSTEYVFVMDDLIEAGGTVVQAMNGVAPHFPKAFIFSGMGVNRPEDREKKLMDQIHTWFYEFADAIEEGNTSLARSILSQADQYRQTYNLEFTPAWSNQLKKLQNLEKKKK